MIAKKSAFILSSIMALSLFCAPLSAVTLTKQYSGSRVRGTLKSALAACKGLALVWNSMWLVNYTRSYLNGTPIIITDQFYVRPSAFGVATGPVWLLVDVYLTRLYYRDACREFEAAQLEDSQGVSASGTVLLREEYSGSKIRGMFKGLVAVWGGVSTACAGVGGCFLTAFTSALAASKGNSPLAVGIVIGGGLATSAVVLLLGHQTRLVYRDACDEFEAASLEERQSSLAAVENAVGESSWSAAEQATTSEWND